LALASALPLLPFCFKRFLLASFSFQAKEGAYFQEKNTERGGSLLSSSCSSLSFLAPISTVPFLLLCFKHFLMTSSFSQVEEKKKKTKKKKP
jgi:hypothetical protein